LEKHLANLEAYKDTVANLARNEDAEYGGVALFVETHSDFSEFFLHSPGHPFNRCVPGKLPLFPEIERPLRKAAEKVDWIILGSCNNLSDDVIDAHALRCGELDKSLKRQKMEPCQHFGMRLHDKSTPEHPLKFTHNTGSDKIDFSFTPAQHALSEEEFRQIVIEESCKALNALESGETFAATLSVKIFIEWFGEYILAHKLPNESLTTQTLNQLLEGLRKPNT
jgi:hypothetical protein